MEAPTLNIRYFGLTVKSEDQEIDLTKLTNEFDLDVYLNSNKTLLQQEQNGIVTAVSKSYIQLCKINKNPKPSRPTGFISIQYSEQKSKAAKGSTISETQSRTTITRPPVGPIPQGAWCSVCKNKGPHFHKINCRYPTNDSLRITLFGFITCVVEKNWSGDEDVDSDILNLKSSIIGHRDYNNSVNKDNYLNIFESIDTDDVRVQGEADGWPLLDIEYKRVVVSVGPKSSKDKSFFSNCSIISYNFENEGSISVRVYNSGLINFVSCPWEHKSFYKKLVQNINKTDSVVTKNSDDQDTYIINPDESLITSTFSTYNIFGSSGYELDLDAIYSYFWPLDDDGNPTMNNISPKRVFTKVYTYSKTNPEVDHNYLIYLDSETTPFYRYSIDYRSDLTTPKIIMRLIPCVGSKELPDYCKPFKITVMIFATGNIQCIFSYCKDKDIGVDPNKLCDESPFLTKGLDSQFQDIQNELEESMNFIYSNIYRIENTAVKDIGEKDSKKREMIDTVSGNIPYKKKENLDKGDVVEIFNPTKMDWGQTGIIRKFKSISKTYDVDIIDDDERKTGEEITNLRFQDIRAKDQSAMQISPSKPEPFSFKGECDSSKQYVPFGGRQGRDNLYYPYCATKSDKKYKMYIDHILDGFPNSNEEEEEFNIERDAELDYYSGIFKKGTTDVGNSIKFQNPDTNEIEEGMIVDKRRSKGGKLDNFVIYTVEVDSGIGTEKYEITGDSFIPEYRQDRRWPGLQDFKKEKLLTCAKKLGLSQSSFTTENQNIRLQNKLIDELNELMGTEDEINFGKSTSVLTPTTIQRFEERAYMAAGFPKGSQRVVFYSNGDNQYFMDENTRIMKLFFDDIQDTILLDGYIKKEKTQLVYYPVDCLVYKDKLEVNYLTEEAIDINTDLIIEDLENMDIPNISSYSNIIDNLGHGRLYYTILLSKILRSKSQNKNIRIAKPEEYIVPFVNEPNGLGQVIIDELDIQDRSLIEDVYTLFKNKNNLDLTFIPQKGNANYLRWKRLLKTNVVLELIKKVKGGYIVGINKKQIQPFGNTVISIPAKISKSIEKRKKKYLRFDLNFMNNGKLYSEDPLTLDLIDPIASDDDVLTHKRTQLIVNAMIAPIPERVFKSSKTEWKLLVPKLLELESQETDSGISPLVKIN
jgi:hypothetical protein